MKSRDAVRLAWGAVRGSRLRASLALLGIAIGVASVVLLTSIGEGARRFVQQEFLQFGGNVLQVSPGKVETIGVPGVVGGSTRKLTLADASSLRRIEGVTGVAPNVFGQARVEGGERGRSVYVLGTTHDALEMWRVELAQGTFLAAGESRSSTAVLGARLARELFPAGDALGAFVRVGGWRLRVIGVAAPRGQLLGWDFDDVAYVPVATALALFDRTELHEIDVAFQHVELSDSIVAAIRSQLAERHGGREDFTVVTQSAMLEMIDGVLVALTVGVGALGAVSLVVGAVGVLTILWISVGERTEEIGLCRALGATTGDIAALFLAEATALASAGGMTGLALGLGTAALLELLWPALDLAPRIDFVLAALVMSAAVGLLAGMLPALRAARLDPVEALRSE